MTAELTGGTVRTGYQGQHAELSEHDFVEATVGRLPGNAPVPAPLRAILCCLA